MCCSHRFHDKGLFHWRPNGRASTCSWRPANEAGICTLARAVDRGFRGRYPPPLLRKKKVSSLLVGCSIRKHCRITSYVSRWLPTRTVRQHAQVAPETGSAQHPTRRSAGPLFPCKTQASHSQTPFRCGETDARHGQTRVFHTPLSQNGRVWPVRFLQN